MKLDVKPHLRGFLIGVEFWHFDSIEYEDFSSPEVYELHFFLGIFILILSTSTSRIEWL